MTNYTTVVPPTLCSCTRNIDEGVMKIKWSFPVSKFQIRVSNLSGPRSRYVVPQFLI